MKRFFTLFVSMMMCCLSLWAADAVTPAYAATNLSFTRDGSRLTGTFVKGAGATRIVVVKEGAAVTGLPVNGVEYSANNDFATAGTGFTGAGEFVVAKISGNSFVVNKLKPGTTYHVAIFEYNGTGAATMYLMTPLSGSDATVAAPVTQAYNFVSTAVTGNTIALSWAKGSGENRIVLARKGGAVAAVPQDLTLYTPSDAFTLGSKIGTDNYVVYKNSGTSVTVKNLEPNTVYHFSIFEYNGISLPVHLVPGASYSVSTSQGPDKGPGVMSFSNVEGNRMRVSVAAGNGTRRLFIARKGSAVTASPVNGSIYTAADFGNPVAEIQPGEFVVGATTNNYVDVTNLEPNTVYHFKVFEYDVQSSGYPYYLTSLYSVNSRSTLTAPSSIATGLKVNSFSGTSATIGFTPGSGTYRMVIIREGQAVTAQPANLSIYSGNGTFKLGTQITPDNYCIIGSTSGNTVTFNSLERGRTYHIAIFEFNGSTYPVYSVQGAPLEFTMPLEPTAAANSPFVQNKEGASVRLLWTKGTGTRRLIIAKKGSVVLARPTDLATYTASNNFGEGDQVLAGEFVVYDGDEAYFDLRKLEIGTTYHWAVFEYNVGEDGKPDYLTSAFLAATASTVNKPSAQPVISGITAIQANQATVNFSAGNGENRLFVMKKGSDVSLSPQDLTKYFASNNFGSAGSSMTDGNYAVAITNGTAPFVVTGLQPNTTYYVRAYEYNGNQEPAYLLTAPAVMSFTTSDVPGAITPTVAATNAQVENRDGNKLTLKWTSGNGSKRIVVMKVGGAVSFEPVAGINYDANAGFSSGTDLGDGEYVVYNGTGASVDITNLQAATTYHFRVYEYDGTGTLIRYLTAAWLQGTAATVSAPANTALNAQVTPGTRSMKIKWTNGDGSGRLVIVREAQAVSVAPMSLVNYPVDAQFTKGAQLATGEYAVYAGGGDEVVVSGLEENKTYHYSIFEYNGVDAPVYNMTAVQGSGTISGSLPVRLLYFNAIAQNGKAVLTWATAQEWDNDFFTVERSSDGRTFIPVKKMPGANNSSEKIEYAFQDPTILSGTTWYRLKQTDKNGNFSYSSIVYVNPGLQSKPLNVYPNPVKEDLRIEWPGNARYATILVYSANGVLVKQLTLVQGGLMAVNDLKPGTYHLVIFADGFRFNSSVIKQ